MGLQAGSQGFEFFTLGQLNLEQLFPRGFNPGGGTVALGLFDLFPGGVDLGFELLAGEDALLEIIVMKNAVAI